jgi:hypothetical protein
MWGLPVHVERMRRFKHVQYVSSQRSPIELERSVGVGTCPNLTTMVRSTQDAERRVVATGSAPPPTHQAHDRHVRLVSSWPVRFRLAVRRHAWVASACCSAAAGSSWLRGRRGWRKRKRSGRYSWVWPDHGLGPRDTGRVDGGGLFSFPSGRSFVLSSARQCEGVDTMRRGAAGLARAPRKGRSRKSVW